MTALQGLREDIRKPWEELPEGKTYGVVHKVNRVRQFGFLFERQSLKKLFFHAKYAAFFFQLEPGDVVMFDIAEDEVNGKGKVAVNVEKFDVEGVSNNV